MRTIQIETITLKDGSKISAIRDIDAVNDLIEQAKSWQDMAHRFYSVRGCRKTEHRRIMAEEAYMKLRSKYPTPEIKDPCDKPWLREILDDAKEAYAKRPDWAK